MIRGHIMIQFLYDYSNDFRVAIILHTSILVHDIIVNPL